MDGTMLEDLRTLLGESRVSTDREVLTEHASDKWFASGNPEVVVFPKSTGDVGRLLEYAASHSLPVTSRGAGVGYVGGAVPLQGGILLSLRQMNRILEINPKDGVAVVQPGVLTGDLQDAALKLGWFYPPDPASLRECTLGGNIATNAGGPRCLKYGVTRNYVLGLTVVLADGRVVELGGRTHKNKTGFDLVGLMVGSEGMLGVVTEAILRIIPHPQTRGAVSVGFHSMQQAAAAVQRILDGGFLPAALEIADGFTLEAARQHLGKDVVPNGNAHLLVEVDGRDACVRHELDCLKSLLIDSEGIDPKVANGEEECETLWKLRREFSYSLKATGLTKLNEDIVVPRSRLVDLVNFAGKLQKESGFPVACFGHAGDGNIHVNIMAANYHGNPATRRGVDALLDRLFRQVVQWGGTITGEHGVGLAKMPWWEMATSKETRSLHAAVKSALDPKGILNPGKFLG